MIHDEENDPVQLDPDQDEDRDRLRELTVRGGGYVLLFLTFAPLAAVTILQIPTDAPETKYMIHPSAAILDALKLWMVAVIPIFGSVIPMTEVLQGFLSVRSSLKVAKLVKIVLIWIGAAICIAGILKFLKGL